MTPRKNVDTDHLRRLYDEGMSVMQMAPLLGVSRPIVASRLRELGLPVRSRSDANRLRMQRLSAQERRDLTLAANNAIRASRRPPAAPRARTRDSEAVARRRAKAVARTRAARLSVRSPDEVELARHLRDLGVDFTPQQVFGTYNIDIAVGNVAVEVHSAATDPRRRSSLAQRSMNLLDAGWSVVHVWRAFGRNDAEHLVALIDRLRGLPTGRSEYWMIRSDGELCAVSRDQLAEFARVPRR